MRTWHKVLIGAGIAGLLGTALGFAIIRSRANTVVVQTGPGYAAGSGRHC